MTSEQQAQVEALIQEAVEHYRAEHFQEAIECFKKANDIREEPELLFNIARSHEKLLHRKEAIEWYERFLEAPGTLRELRKRALDSIAVLHQEIIDEETLQKSEGAPSDQTSAPPLTTESGTDTEPSPTDTAAPTEKTDTQFSDNTAPPKKSATDGQSDRSPSRMRIASYSLLGIGSAALIVGGVFGGLSLGAKSDFDSAGYDPVRVEHRADMRRDALIFDIAFFSGVAVVVAGASLLVVDVVKNKSRHEEALGRRGETRGNPKERSVRLTPSFMVGQKGLTGGLVGHF